MSYVVLATAVDEVDVAAGFNSNGAPNHIITHGQGTTFTPQGAQRSVSDAATTNGQPTLTSATAAFTSADVGKTVTATGIPANTTIQSVTNSTTAVMNHNATATGSALSLTIGAASQLTNWIASGAVAAVAGGPSVASIAPTHAPVHSRCALTGTAMSRVSQVTMKLTAAGGTVPAVGCAMHEKTATSVSFFVPLVAPGAYTVTAWIYNYAIGTAALTVDAVPT